MISHILIGVDGSPTSKDAAVYGLKLAEQTKAKVTLIFVLETPPVIPIGPLSAYVMTAPPRTEEDVKRARAELAELAKERPTVTTDSRVELGNPADVLCEQAGALGVDLLIVGARGLSTGARWLLGSVSDRAVHHAPCPVLVVRDRHAVQVEEDKK